MAERLSLLEETLSSGKDLVWRGDVYGQVLELSRTGLGLSAICLNPEIQNVTRRMLGEGYVLRGRFDRSDRAFQVEAVSVVNVMLPGRLINSQLIRGLNFGEEMDHVDECGVKYKIGWVQLGGREDFALDLRIAAIPETLSGLQEDRNYVVYRHEGVSDRSIQQAVVRCVNNFSSKNR